MTKKRVYVKVSSDFDSTGYMQPTSITWSDGRTFQSKQCATSVLPGLPITVTLVTVLLCSSKGRKSTCSLSTLIHASTVG